MKYQFLGSFIVATAETLQENAVLISTQGALQLNVVKAAPHKLPKEKKKYTHRIERNSQEMREMRDGIKKKVEGVRHGDEVFFSDSEAKGRAYLNSFLFSYLTRQQGIRFSAKAVPGGTKLTIK